MILSTKEITRRMMNPEETVLVKIQNLVDSYYIFSPYFNLDDRQMRLPEGHSLFAVVKQLIYLLQFKHRIYVDIRFRGHKDINIPLTTFIHTILQYDCNLEPRPKHCPENEYVYFILTKKTKARTG